MKLLSIMMGATSFKNNEKLSNKQMVEKQRVQTVHTEQSSNRNPRLGVTDERYVRAVLFYEKRVVLKVI